MRKSNIVISSDAIGRYLWAVKSPLTQYYGVCRGTMKMYPLEYYINSGRASADFLRKLLSADPKIISKILSYGGSDAEVMDRIKREIGFSATF